MPPSIARPLTLAFICDAQVMHCEDLLPDMRASARKAVKAMQRAPIADLVQ